MWYYYIATIVLTIITFIGIIYITGLLNLPGGIRSSNQMKYKQILAFGYIKLLGANPMNFQNDFNKYSNWD